jgi:large subunit ribosomal protein L31e
MGKKINNASKVRKAGKELQPVIRKMRVNLHKHLHDCKFKKKAPRAVNTIKELARKTMFTQDVRIDPELNKELWKNGIKNIMSRIDIVMERKKNEEDEEAKEKMYTLVKLGQNEKTQA